MVNPANLDNGTEVFFKIGTGTVFRGEIVGRDELMKQYAATDYSDEDNLVRVEIDRDTSHSDEDLPDHLAPSRYQPNKGDGSLFRDAYTIDAKEQHYIVTPDTLVEIL